jgi:type I site-specific restriction endonuclease
MSFWSSRALSDERRGKSYSIFSTVSKNIPEVLGKQSQKCRKWERPPSALERRFTIPARNRAMVSEFQEVLTRGYIDSKGIQRKPLLGKRIVFAVTKRHAETLAVLFDTAFAALKPSPDVRYADYVVSGLGNEDSADAS